MDEEKNVWIYYRKNIDEYTQDQLIQNYLKDKTYHVLGKSKELDTNYFNQLRKDIIQLKYQHINIIITVSDGDHDIYLESLVYRYGMDIIKL